MPAIRIVHLGDVHYPSHESSIEADTKTDEQRQTAEGVSEATLEVVGRKIAERLADTALETVVLVSGDITTNGKVPNYVDGVKWLAGLVKSQDHDRVVIVPGNHDVDRSAAKDERDKGKASTERLKHAKKAWKSQGFSQFASPMPIQRDMACGGSLVRFIGLNSCGLAGWDRAFDKSAAQLKEIESVLHDRIRDLFAGIVTSDPVDTVTIAKELGDSLVSLSEVIDGPAILKDQFQALRSLLIQNQPDALQVVSVHHPLLQQRRDRYSPYSEMVNGGNLRDLLSKSGTPTLLIHGHTHVWSFEEIADLDLQHGQRIVSLSAPEIKDGFNELVVHFSSGGSLLGIDVTFHEAGGGNWTTKRRRLRMASLSEQEEQDLAFILLLAAKDFALKPLSSKKSKRDKFKNGNWRTGEYWKYRFDEVVSYSNQIEPTPKGSDLVELLLKGYFARRIEIKGLPFAVDLANVDRKQEETWQIELPTGTFTTEVSGV